MLDGYGYGCHIPVGLRERFTARFDGVPMTTLVTRVMTWLQGEPVGKDSFGQ